MNRKEREEVFKAINAVANRVNEVSQKLDEVMQMLNANSHKLIHNQSIEKQATKSIRKLLGKIYI